MSAAGAVLNRAGLWYTRRYQKKTGITLMYDSIYQKAEPFRITDWKPPRGYVNTEISLSNSRGFLLKNTDLNTKRAVYHIHGGAYISAFSKSYNDTAVQYSKCFGNADVFFGSYDAAIAPRYPVPIDYAGECDPHEPYISPVYGSFAALPPMLIQTGENELLLSDSETIAAKAEEAGTDAQLLVYPLMCHTFYIVVPWIAESKKAWQRIRTYMEACIDE